MITKVKKWIIRFLIASSILVLLIVLLIGSLFYLGTRNEILDSTHSGPYHFQGAIYKDSLTLKLSLLEFGKFPRLKNHVSKMECRRVKFPLFTGIFGCDYITYSVETDEIEKEISLWWSDPASVDKKAINQLGNINDHDPPKWWPEENKLELIALIEKDLRYSISARSQAVWLDRTANRFYIYYCWGH